MTVVELLEKSPAENGISTLALQPDRVIFVGGGKEVRRAQAFYGAFYRKMGYRTVVQGRAVDTRALPKIVEVLSDIVSKETDCVIDLTGGHDLLLTAAGIVYERFRERQGLRLHRFHVRSGAARDVITGEALTAYAKPRLTVEQHVMLYGGVIGGSADGDQWTDWEWTPAFSQAIERMWTVCRRDPAFWNSALAALGELEACKRSGGDPQRTVVDADTARHMTSRADRLLERAQALLTELERVQVVTCRSRKDGLDFTYADAQVRRALSKAGNLLELYTLSQIRALCDDEGHSLFQDSRCGVHIDWSGQFGDSAQDTLNEIDVLAMSGMIPVFISCKNGKAEDEELYKLHTVAQRFGGAYAVKVLMATYIDRDDRARAHLLQRARDMGIRVIADAHLKSKDDLREALRRACLG